MAGLLEGIRVLDLSRLLPGPYCTLLLADLGAEVIKVEEPGQGDYLRLGEPKQGDMGAAFLVLNRNKKSVAINLKAPEGRDVFRRLAQTADVVLEGFRPGVMDRLGLGYDTLNDLNPRLVYCSLSGYGQDGPYRHNSGHDVNYIGYSGLLDLTGPAGGSPIVPAGQIADVGGGALMAAFGILAALLARSNSGKGQYVDVSMTDGVFSWMSLHVARHLASGVSPARGQMYLNGGLLCYGVYETRDGRHVALGALEEKFWANFCEAIGRPDLIQHQFVRGEEQKPLLEEVKAIFRGRTRDEWAEFFSSIDACGSPVLSMEEALKDPQLRERRMLVEVDQPGVGKVLQVGAPVKFSGVPEIPLNPAPSLGQHTSAILIELGYEQSEIARLAQQRVIEGVDNR